MEYKPKKKQVQLELKPCLSQEEEKKQKEIEAKARVKFMTSGLSQRLQSENPFDEFRQAVENAFI
jgi:hypothetical protein